MAKRNDLKIQAELLEEILELEKKIEEQGKATAYQQKRLNKLKNAEFLMESKKISLTKQIENIQKSALGIASKKLGLEKQFKTLGDLAKVGTKKEIDQAKKLTAIMGGVADGSKDFADALEEIATGNFDKLNGAAEEFGDILRNNSGNLEQTIKDASKVKKGFDTILDTLAPIDLEKTFTLAGALAAVVSLAKETARVRQELGLSVSESAGLATKTTILSNAFSIIGGEGEEILNFSKGIASEFGNISELSFKTLTNFGLLQLRTGITGDNAAKLAKSIQSIQGGSLETSLNTISTFENLSRAAGVAPKLVLDDVAESTELFAKFAKDGGENLAKAAIEARKLGLNLSAVDKISESILDFESSIEKQMEASVLLGRQLNLDKARQLALEGDLEGVLAEVKNQVGGTEALNRMNVVQRKALADAVGLEVSELSKLAAGQENVNKLTNGQMLSLGKTFAITAGIVTVLSGAVAFLVSMMPGGKLRLLRGIVGGKRGLAFGAKAGVAAGGIATVGQAMMPKAQTGGVVRETGMAVVHKGETIAGTQFGGRESNKLLKQMIEQNATLMNRLTNKVGDLALSS